MVTDVLEEQFLDRTLGSRALFEDAGRYLPGGVAGNGKFLPPYPVYVSQAQGATLIDVDGNSM